MIALNKQTDHAVSLIVALSKIPQGEVLSLRRFALDSSISFLFLQRVARALRSAGIVESVRGAHGGYRLLKDPSSISFREVIEAIEGPIAVIGCARGDGCELTDRCEAQQPLRKIEAEIAELLASRFVVHSV